MIFHFANGPPFVGQNRTQHMSASKFNSPSHSEISARAEQLYRESGCVPGRDLENWVQAESELKQRLESNGAAAKTKASGNGKASARTQREKQRV
jgi:hypothetical protein